MKLFKEFVNENYDSFDNAAGDDFWGNMGAGVLIICPLTSRILIAYRSIYVNEPHTYNLIGGKIDDNENIEETLTRELEEETGYSNEIELIPSYIFKTDSNSFIYHNYIGLVQNEFNPTLNWETEYFKWVTLDELFKLKNKWHFGLKKLIENDLNNIKKYI
jgi:8-oxo-dGTP pyrophosphatase MutT (NUDIX family)